MRIVALALLALTGCGPAGTDATPDGGGGGDASDGAGPAGPGLAGLLIGPSEELVLGVDVLACMATTCLYGESSAVDGTFEFEIDPPASVALKTHPDLAKVPRWAAALEPVQIVDGALVDTGTLYIPDLPAGSVLMPATADPQTHMAGDGLELTLRRSDMTVAVGEFLYDVAARLVPPEHVPPYPALGGEEVVAVYALHPFGAQCTSPIGVRAPTTLAAGTAVNFRTISHIDGTFSPAAPGQSDGVFVATDPGTGIPALTYLVISR